jgi:predicted 2-oxoglutarate/Fe(II)-dependent dioxygenase YbiX
MKLSKEEFGRLLTELYNTPTLTQQEIDSRARIVKEFTSVQEGTTKILLGSNLTHYSTKNETLNKIIKGLTNRETKDIIAFHTIESVPPCETKNHTDSHSVCTLNILLEDNFEGGEFYLNGKKYHGLKERGDYVVYNGGKDSHAVSKITKGVRKSLIVWYSKNKELI